MSGVRVIDPAALPGYAGGGRRTRVLLDPATGHEGLELFDVALGVRHYDRWQNNLAEAAGTIGIAARAAVFLPVGVFLAPSGRVVFAKSG